MKFERLVGRRVDLYTVRPADNVLTIDHDLELHSYVVQVSLRPAHGGRDEPKPHNFTVRDGAQTLDLTQIELVALQVLSGHRKGRPSIARVRVENMRGRFTEKDLGDTRKVFADHPANFDGYRLRDPKTGHVWLIFGIRNRDHHTASFIFHYTPR